MLINGLFVLQAISAMSVKLSDLVPVYKDNKRSGDFFEWCERLELVAKLQGIKETEKFLPLFLQEAAFSVYKELSNEAKGDYEELKKQLAAAFGVTGVHAYEKFRERSLHPGESVDAYFADLKRLLTAVGASPLSESLLRAAYVAGLPGRCKSQVLMLSQLDTMDMDTLLAKTRTLLSVAQEGACEQRHEHRCEQGAAGSARGREIRSAQVTRGPSKGVCFNCGKPGHMMKDCWQRRATPTCTICKRQGHLSRDCRHSAPTGAWGNDQGESTTVPVASPQDESVRHQSSA